MFAYMHSLETCNLHTYICSSVRSCPTKTYYILTHGKINSNVSAYVQIRYILATWIHCYTRVKSNLHACSNPPILKYKLPYSLNFSRGKILLISRFFEQPQKIYPRNIYSTIQFNAVPAIHENFIHETVKLMIPRKF